MRFSYVSRWTSRDARTFQLWGVIAAGPDAESAFFRHEEKEPDSEAEETGNELRRHWEAVRAWMSPLEWLEELSTSGNGINEEYDAVQEVEAPSLAEAARVAYEQTVSRLGREIELFPETAVGAVADLGDSLGSAGAWPPPLRSKPNV